MYKWEENELLLDLYIQPNAKKDEIIGEYNNRLKIRISAPPLDNKANKYLIKYLAKTFAVPTSCIELLKGENQRNKRVKISTPAKVPGFIERPKSK